MSGRELSAALFNEFKIVIDKDQTQWFKGSYQWNKGVEQLIQLRENKKETRRGFDKYLQMFNDIHMTVLTFNCLH